MKKEQTYKLTNREYDILRILWASEDPLTASGIVEETTEAGADPCGPDCIQRHGPVQGLSSVYVTGRL